MRRFDLDPVDQLDAPILHPLELALLAIEIFCENSGLAAIQVLTVFEQGSSGGSSSIRASPVSDASLPSQISSVSACMYLVGRPRPARSLGVVSRCVTLGKL